jgi:hypothetical protein
VVPSSSATGSGTSNGTQSHFRTVPTNRRLIRHSTRTLTADTHPDYSRLVDSVRLPDALGLRPLRDRFGSPI